MKLLAAFLALLVVGSFACAADRGGQTRVVTPKKQNANGRNGNRDGGKDQDERFKKLDANSDGWLTRQEFGGDKAGFDKLDRNKDGKVTLREFGAHA